MICKEYQAERNDFLKKIIKITVSFGSCTNQEQFLFFMSTNDTENVLKDACRFFSPQGDNQDVRGMIKKFSVPCTSGY